MNFKILSLNVSALIEQCSFDGFDWSFILCTLRVKQYIISMTISTCLFSTDVACNI